MGVKCFFLDRDGMQRRWLRRFVFSTQEGVKCPGPHGYHDAMTLLDEVLEVITDRGTVAAAPQWDHDDPRWPTKCAQCDYEFADGDEFQVFTRTLYKRRDTGEVLTIEDAPPGAMWYADWMIHEGSNWNRGPDGHCLAVKCPDESTWMVDSRASNCDMPNDDAHKCWVRHGDVPLITVDKNGLTCHAGAGSIQTARWHGYLRNGELVT